MSQPNWPSLMMANAYQSSVTPPQRLQPKAASDNSKTAVASGEYVSFSRIDLLNHARNELYARAWPSPSSIEYVRRSKIDTNAVAGFCGCVAVLPISILPGSTFDFKEASDGETVEAVVIEALDRDGETPIDLVAWPLDKPSLVLTMFRQAPLLGMWQALNAYSFALGKPLKLHRTPLAWLQSSCDGAAIVRPEIGVRLLLDAHGPIACEDRAHAAEVIEMQVTADRRRLVVPRVGKSFD